MIFFWENVSISKGVAALDRHNFFLLLFVVYKKI